MKTIVLLSLLFARVAVAAPPKKPPNIVFIFSDDHAQQAISAYGSKVNKTPNIDRIGKEGARFANSFVTNSLCTPSRGAILTGKFGHLTGVRFLSDTLKPGTVTFAKLMHDAGYQTAVVGKWHLKTNPEAFDYFEVLRDQGQYYNPDFITAAGTHQEHGYTTELIGKKIIDWIGKRDPNKPFLAMMHHKAPHRSWEPGPNELGMYAGTKFPEPATLFDDYAGRASPAHNQKMEIGRDMTLTTDLKIGPDGKANPNKRLDDEQRKLWNEVYDKRAAEFASKNLTGKALTSWKYQEYMKDYLRCVAAVDKSVGQLLAYLDREGLAKDTVVVYGSDQGFYLGEHGWFDKRWIYEESLRTPLLVRWPGVTKPNTVINEMVQNLDYAQTFLDISGVPAAADMQGKSLVPLLRGQHPKDWRKAVYYHYYDQGHEVAVQYGMRTDRFTLVHYPKTSEWELFDLQKDPRQMKSVYDDAKYGKQLVGLKDELTRLREQYKDNE